MMILCWRSGRRRSRNLYLSLRSSLVLDSASIWNGGTSDSESMRSCFARTSYSPVASSVLTPPARFSSVPTTAMQYSARSLSAFSKDCVPQSDSSNMICNMPVLSRRSVNMMPPLFLLFCTQPITVTSLPVGAPTTSAHLCVLFKPSIASAITVPLLCILILNKSDQCFNASL